jgi:hypothetical protein
MNIMTQEQYVQYAKSFTFSIGESYLHNSGEYVIDSMNNEKILVTFKDGSKKEFGKEMAKKIHLNKTLEVLKPYISKSSHSKIIGEDKPFIEGNFKQEDFAWTLGAFARYSNIRAEVGGTENIEKFVKRYGSYVENITISNIKKNTNILFPERYKFGQELRIAIPSVIVKNKRFCLPGLGHIEESTKEKKTIKINNCRLVWQLIERWGFQFAKTQNYKRISDYIEEQYKKDFEDGYSLVID